MQHPQPTRDPSVSSSSSCNSTADASSFPSASGFEILELVASVPVPSTFRVVGRSLEKPPAADGFAVVDEEGTRLEDVEGTSLDVLDV